MACHPHAVPGLGTAASCHLRQHRFGLRQPEGHVHGTVQVEGGRQAGAGLRTPSYLTIQHAKTTAAEMTCTPYNLFSDAVRSVSAVDV